MAQTQFYEVVMAMCVRVTIAMVSIEERYMHRYVTEVMDMPNITKISCMEIENHRNWEPPENDLKQ